MRASHISARGARAAQPVAAVDGTHLSRGRHSVGLRTHDAGLHESHQCGVDSEGRLHRQVAWHDRCDDDDALEKQLMRRPIALREIDRDQTRERADHAHASDGRAAAHW